ncbi:hypothetical protein KI387_027168, partial [Taxus chinensis]
IHNFDPYKEMEEAELGFYCLHEENLPTPSLIKLENEDVNEVWKLFFVISRRKHGGGGGSILSSPK